MVPGQDANLNGDRMPLIARSLTRLGSTERAARYHTLKNPVDYRITSPSANLVGYVCS